MFEGRVIGRGQDNKWLTFPIWLEERISVCGLNVETRWWRNILDLFKSSNTPVPSGFFKGGTGSWLRKIFLVVYQCNLSVDDRASKYFVKFSDLIRAKDLLSLLVRLLNTRLSDGYLVLWKVASAFRFSDISCLIK